MYIALQDLSLEESEPDIHGILVIDARSNTVRNRDLPRQSVRPHRPWQRVVVHWLRQQFGRAGRRRAVVRLGRGAARLRDRRASRVPGSPVARRNHGSQVCAGSARRSAARSPRTRGTARGPRMAGRSGHATPDRRRVRRRPPVRDDRRLLSTAFNAIVYIDNTGPARLRT